LSQVNARVSEPRLDSLRADGGGPTWTDAAHRYLGLKLIQLVADYNGSVAAEKRLQGVQPDIEPDVDPSFFDDVERSLQDYLSWWVGRAAFRQAAEEIAAAYGRRPQFRGLSVNDMNAYQAAGRSPMILTGRH
jgi:hypothetical protein